MIVEPIFEVEMTYDENMFYHQVLASKKRTPAGKKKQISFLQDIKFTDLVMGCIAFAVYFMAVSGADLPTRISQSVFATIIFVILMKQLNRRKHTDDENSSETSDRRQARGNLDGTGQEGESLKVSFGEDSFEVESPGIVTEYRYEGIGWIKETSEFYMIFWNSTMVIPVEKKNFSKGRPEQFKAFLEKKCGKTVEVFRAAV